MKAKVYNTAGEVVRSAELEPKIFEVKVNPVVVQRAVLAQEANSRGAVAHTKTRGDVRGGGKKPWRQKGTGRARHGSIRSPIWVGGGVAFGPKSNRNFTQRVNKKELRKALFMGLSSKAAEEKVILLDELSLPSIKTKQLVAILKKLPIEARSSLLLVQPKVDPVIVKSARNLSRVSTIMANSLNLRDVLKHEYLVMPVSGLDAVTSTFLPSSKNP